MKVASLLKCNGCYELRIYSVAVSLLLFLIIGDLSSEVIARRRSKHQSGSNLYIRKHSHNKGHSRSKEKVKPRHKYYSNTWAVSFHPPHRDVAERVSKKHGFQVLGQIGNLEGHYHIKHKDVSESAKAKAQEKTDLLRLEEEVKWAEQQEILRRYKREAIPTDPEFPNMWYLLNTGQATGPAGVDINVTPVWKKNITGNGVVIAICDDGVDYTHPDLAANYDKSASTDLNDNDDDPKPRDSDPDNCHGTRCAGEVAAVANNGICGAGVAYNAKIGGIRMLDGQATDALEARALGFKSEYIDIYINCWGPKDDGKTFGKPGPIAARALKEGAENGRNSLGSIFIWATGNGGLTDDDCNCDGYTTSIYTISIGCIGDHGLSAYYTEKCSSTLAVTFNGASHREGKENKMITTDLYHQCTEEFKGTSASAPIAAGIMALALEANPRLTWRDMQHLIVNTAQITSPVDEGWMKNGAGFHFNHKFGFGRLDADALVEAAKGWQNVPTQRMCTAYSSFDEQNIPIGNSLYINIPTCACKGIPNAEITKLEHVVLTVSFVHKRRGQVSIDLFSPAETRSQMLSTRKYDESDEGLDEWNFMTVHKWGENPRGIWKLKITDNNNLEQNDLDSQQETDVEDLEEKVIDEKAKQQRDKWNAARAQNPNIDYPYPPGVRRNNVARQDFGVMDGGVTAPIYNSPEQDYPASYRSSIARPDEFIDATGGVIIENPEYAEAAFESMRGGQERYFKRSIKNNRFRRSTESQGFEIDANGIVKELDEENFEREVKSRYSEKENRPKRGMFEDSGQFFDSNAYKKVQVTEEETGTQRVQVNAGYENPKISCVKGSPCSGVLLKFVLTFYGTNEINTAQRGMPCMY